MSTSRLHDLSSSGDDLPPPGRIPLDAGEEQTADILVVDDDAANLVAIEAALGEFDGRVRRAHSGREALRLMLEQDFAVVLLDIRMPTMDGFGTARVIRSRDRTKHTPLIFITAHDRDDGDMRAAYELGAVDFLTKPIVPDVLRAKVSVFVELRQRAVEMARQAQQIREHERRERDRAFAEERARWQAETMRQQMEQLASASRHKDRFLAVLSHELRNPLAPLVAGLGLIKERLSAGVLPDPEVYRIHTVMERQVQHLLRLVDELLDISRITSGKIELRKERIAISELVHQAVAMSQPAIEEREHSFKASLPDEDVFLFADGARLVQVLANLLNNAARYTPRGGKISLNVERRNQRIQIHVADNGEGITPEFLDHVFDSFTQERQSSGLGLGLAVVKQIVALHGGGVSAASPGRGQGSCFTVTLQSDDGHDASERGEQRAPAPPKPASKTQRALSIVLVEDSADIREMIGEVFESWGHAVAGAEDGEQGAVLIIETMPDVALIDIGLPLLDGYQVAARVREALGERAPRLVAMTGFGQEADKRRAREAGFHSHLVKPASMEALREVLRFEEPS